jgi:exosortase E/protease (VPEID-CTERM system)
MTSENIIQGHVSAPSKRFLIRWLLLLAIAALELGVLTARYEAPPLQANKAEWPAWLFHFSKEIWPAGLWIIAACYLILSPRLKTILDNLREHGLGYRWQVWLARHALALAAFAAITQLIFGMPSDPARLSLLWLTGWAGLASITLLSWMMALAPGRFWRRLMHQEHTALLVGSILGMGAWILVSMLSQHKTSLLGQNEFWNFLGIPSLLLARFLLGWFYPDIVYQPERFLLGTDSFQVKVSYVCSGIEGISLITLFIAVYLWVFRKELRFPQVFWLFPLGMIAVWLLNAVRIAILIALGTSFSPEIALQGFHAQAGWIVFTLIGVAAIALSNRMQCFTATQTDFQGVKSSQPLAAALLVPFMGLMAATMATSAFSTGFDLLYPLRILILAALLYCFRKYYKSLGWKWTWQAPAIGSTVFIVWILLEPDAGNGGTVLLQGLGALPSETAALWLIFRVLGSVIAVPLAEELAFRGYLIRKLIAKEFERVPPRQFTWLSFLLTSVLFGLLHDRWLAGTLAGMAYALALYRRGQMGDAVIAHMTTNALIAVFVLTQAKWSLWS